MKQRQLDHKQSASQRDTLVPVIVPIIVAIIGAIGIVVAAFFTDESGEYRGRQSTLSELSPTIELQETRIASLMASSITQPITVTEIVYATPIADTNVASIEDLAKAVRIYAFTDSRVITPEAKLKLASSADQFLDYRIDFNIPEDERSSIGIAFDLEDPTDISSFKYLDISIEFSTKELECSLIISDAAGGSGSVNIGSSRPSGNNISISVAESVQTIQVPLDDNYSKVNKKIVTTIFCVTGSDFMGSGEYYMIFRDIKFRKE